MKILAISNHERDLIIQHLADFGNWEGTRYGAHVRLVRFETKAGNEVQFSVGLGSLIMVGRSLTVMKAIDQVNEIIIGAPIHGTRTKRAVVGREVAATIPHRQVAQQLLRWGL